MNLNKDLLCIILMFIKLPIILGQDKVNISGHIFDSRTTQPLSYVNIFVQDEKWGAMSDSSGYYQFSVPSNCHYKIIFSMMGYKTSEKIINANGDLTINVTLLPIVLLMPGVSISAPKTSRQRQNESISSMLINTKQLNNFSFSLNDINRVFKTLPGITSNNGMSSEFNVRGGMFHENLVRIDGINLYNPFHMKVAPNVSISIINTDMIENVNLITGGFPAEYGDKLSSVMDVSFRNGNQERMRLQSEISAIKINSVFEGPIGENSSFLIGLNKSYFELPMKIMEKYHPVTKFYQVKGIPKYYDIQGKLNYTFNSSHTGSFIFLFSKDAYTEDPRLEKQPSYTQNFNNYYININPSDSSYFNGNYSNTLYALILDNHLHRKIYSKTIMSFYKETEDIFGFSKHIIYNQYFVDNNLNVGESNYENVKRNTDKVNIKTFELKHDSKIKLHSFHELSAGFSIQRIYLYNLIEDYTNVELISNLSSLITFSNFDTSYYEKYSTKLSATTLKASLYFQDSWQITDKFFSNLGVRLDYFDFNKNINISPRLSAFWTLNNNTSINIAWGYYYQSPAYYDLKYTYAASQNPQSQKAEHYIIGIRQNIFNQLNLKVDTFLKQYDNLISTKKHFYRSRSAQQNDAVGFAMGVDFQLKLNLPDFYGWVSYSFLNAQEDILTDNVSYYPRSTDQRHTLAIVGNWTVKSNWQLNGKVIYGSGFPYTPMIFDINKLDFVHGPKHSDYLPAYKRIDFRISRDFNLSWGQINAYFEIINVLNRKNVYMYEQYYLNKHNNVDKKPRTLLPRLPNIGFKIYFN